MSVRAKAAPVATVENHRPAAPDGGLAVALTIGLVALALGAAAWRCGMALPVGQWLPAALDPGTADPARIVFHYATLPRLVVAALSGAILALSGTVLQHVLRNPLATPVTLGVSSGAQLAIIAATVAAPAGLGAYPNLVALAGGLGAMGLVLAIAVRHRYSSLSLILSGLTVALFLGALGHVLQIFNQDYLSSVFLWNAGALAQTDWSVVVSLLPRGAALAVVLVLLLQPLRLLGFGDESARGLGLSLTGYRIATLVAAASLASVVTAAVGPIGFVDLAAPLIARLAGARRIEHRLVLAPLIGAALLVIVDTLVQALDGITGADLPTGAAASLIAAPLLLVLVPRLRASGDPTDANGFAFSSARGSRTRVFATLSVLLVVALVGSCLVGRTGAGPLALPTDLGDLLPWRWPRALAALAAGGMLGASGTLLQRATGNPLAGPEILGLGAAVMAGLTVALVLFPAPSPPILFVAGAIGAVLLLVALVGTGWRTRFAPDHLILTGVALSAALDAIVIGFLALDDTRSGLLLGWMAGSTAGVEAHTALALCGAAAVLIPAALLFSRPLDLLPLGEGAARGLGLAMTRVRFGVLGIAALLTAAAVMAVGPLTFVGLVGPHLARRLGLVRGATQLAGAALIGGGVMVLADWIGRIALSPYEVPAGLVASLIGCPYLLYQLCRRV